MVVERSPKSQFINRILTVEDKRFDTWLKEEIERLKAEVQHLHQEKALLVERLALSFPQRADQLCLIEDKVGRVNQSLKSLSV